MFDIGLQEMLVIGVLALLVFGPSKLPELGRMVGRAMREFRRASDEFRSTVETNLHINEPDPPPAPSPAPSLQTTEAAFSHEGEALAPVARPEPAVATLEEAPGEPYCAQGGSKIFHRRECAWVARIPPAERVGFPSVAAARDQGFLTCPVCEPWEPA